MSRKREVQPVGDQRVSVEPVKTFNPEQARQALVSYDRAMARRGLLRLVSGVDQTQGVRAVRQRQVHRP